MKRWMSTLAVVGLVRRPGGRRGGPATAGGGRPGTETLNR